MTKRYTVYFRQDDIFSKNQIEVIISEILEEDIQVLSPLKKYRFDTDLSNIPFRTQNSGFSVLYANSYKESDYEKLKEQKAILVRHQSYVASSDWVTSNESAKIYNIADGQHLPLSYFINFKGCDVIEKGDKKIKVYRKENSLSEKSAKYLLTINEGSGPIIRNGQSINGREKIELSREDLLHTIIGHDARFSFEEKGSGLKLNFETRSEVASYKPNLFIEWNERAAVIVSNHSLEGNIPNIPLMDLVYGRTLSADIALFKLRYDGKEFFVNNDQSTYLPPNKKIDIQAVSKSGRTSEPYTLNTRDYAKPVSSFLIDNSKNKMNNFLVYELTSLPIRRFLQIRDFKTLETISYKYIGDDETFRFIDFSKNADYVAGAIDGNKDSHKNICIYTAKRKDEGGYSGVLEIEGRYSDGYKQSVKVDLKPLNGSMKVLEPTFSQIATYHLKK